MKEFNYQIRNSKKTKSDYNDNSKYFHKQNEIINKNNNFNSNILDYNHVNISNINKDDNDSLNKASAHLSFIYNQKMENDLKDNTINNEDGIIEGIDNNYKLLVDMEQIINHSIINLIEQTNYMIEQAKSNLKNIENQFIDYFSKLIELEDLNNEVPYNYIKENNIIYGFNKTGNICCIIFNNKYYTFKFNRNKVVKIIDTSNDNLIYSIEYKKNKINRIKDNIGNLIEINDNIITINDEIFKYSYEVDYSIPTVVSKISSITNSSFKLLFITKNNNLIVEEKINNSFNKVIDLKINKENNIVTLNNNIEKNSINYYLNESKRIGRIINTDKVGNIDTTIYDYRIIDDKEYIKEIYSYSYDNKCILNSIIRNPINKLILEKNEKEYNGYYSILNNTFYEYDFNNNVIKENNNYYINDELDKECITNYFYNNSNTLIKKIKYINNHEELGEYITEYIYNNNCLIKEINYNSLDSSNKYINEYHYDSNNNIEYELDSLGINKTYYSYDIYNNISSILYPNKLKVGYGYNDNKLCSISYNDELYEENKCNIVYNNGYKIKEFSNNNFEYKYDDKGRIVEIYKDNNKIIDYEYSEFNKNDNNINYESSIMRLYNSNIAIFKNELSGIVSSDGIINTNKYYLNNKLISTIIYDKYNRISNIIDEINNTSTIYNYDNNNLLGSIINNKISEVFNYNKRLLISKIIMVNNKEFDYNYKYDFNNNITNININNYSINKKYDLNNRLVNYNINNILGYRISYLKNGSNSSNIPSSIYYNDGEYYKYSYDNMGNVNRVFKNGILINRYSYDCLGRIIREDNKELDKSIVYCYDNNGNILNKYTYKYSTSDLDDKEYILDRYKYNNELLVSINDINYEYDLLGNPIKIGNNILIWNGYLLEKYGNNIFKYNSNGLRIKKNDIEFIYDSNDNLIYSSDGLTFIYDDNKVIGFIYNNNYYFYKYDLLGNINYLIDSNGNIIVKYKYDSYGNHKIFDNNDNEISDEHNIGYINPIRYKGYYYDNETGLYYLKARYYDPKASRFISPDSLDYLDSNNINGLNLYSYCGNDPVNKCDPSGHFSILSLLICIGISLVFEVIEDALDGNGMDHDWKDYLGAGISGAFGGLGGNFIQQIVFTIAGGMIDAWLSGDLEQNGFGNSLVSIALSSVISSQVGKITNKLASNLKATSLKKLKHNIANKQLKTIGLNIKIGSKIVKEDKALSSIIRKESNWIGNIFSKNIGSSVSGSVISISYGQIINYFGINF